ncbi:hypothetical protein [Phaffia rhodozyma]|uniref:Uncharacterized protein n=1 Tax=Phaffia rhodozyma TaxID=264483 RepID=A0A0F7SYB9_PHARH|nr:hypothetical protein [Phaffia rhodozyma]
MDTPINTSAPTSLDSTSFSHPAPSIPTPTTDTELYSSDEDPSTNPIGGDGGSAFETPCSSQQSNPSRNPESSLRESLWSATSTNEPKGLVRGEGRRGRQNDGENGQNGGRLSSQMEATGEGASGPNGGTYAQGGTKDDRLLGEREFDALNEEIGDPFDTDEIDDF